VALTDAAPGLRLSVRYHTTDNFTGAPLQGYGAPGAWMLIKPASQLAGVQAALEKRGLGLLVYDAYRPQRGTQSMVAWATRTGKLELFEQGYIARHSGHNHGHTVDLTIVDAAGTPLDMGTPWDTLSEESHTTNARGSALENRLLLQGLMVQNGFRPYHKEWWHFRYPMEGTVPRDMPYGCFEAEEGKWRAPVGWGKPAYVGQSVWPAAPCTVERK
jgi:D-alanyl-D-alanine dipeptidase